MGSTLRTTTSAAPGEKRTCPPLPADSVAAPPENAAEGNDSRRLGIILQIDVDCGITCHQSLVLTAGIGDVNLERREDCRLGCYSPCRRCGTTGGLRLPVSDLRAGAGVIFSLFLTVSGFV